MHVEPKDQLVCVFQFVLLMLEKFCWMCPSTEVGTRLHGFLMLLLINSFEDSITLDPGDACSDACMPCWRGCSRSFLVSPLHGLRIRGRSVPLRLVDHVSVAGALALPLRGIRPNLTGHGSINIFLSPQPLGTLPPFLPAWWSGPDFQHRQIRPK